MARITFEGHEYDCSDSSVLDCLTRHGVAVPASCRSGVCQTCLMRAVKGKPPAAAQKGLKDSLIDQNYFLACSCIPEEDLEVTLSAPESERLPARVESLFPLSEDMVRLRLQVDIPYEYKPGQFLNLYRADGLVRSYSIASLPSAGFLELHLKRIPGGRMSEWIHNDLAAGDTVEISTALGDCYYRPGRPEQGLLLIATGSGLAPLYGILRQALAEGHSGPIALYHGSREMNGLYLTTELAELAARHENLSYTPCVSGEGAEWGVQPGRANEIALNTHPQLKDWRVFLCGHPDMVEATKKKAFLAGVSLNDIYADPFTFSS